MILGDSICYGEGVSREDSWVGLLAASLRGSCPECSLRNFGVNGSTAGQGLSRLPGLLLKPPDLLYVQFGLNDAWQGVSLDRYAQNMRDIAEQALEAGTGAVILATNHSVHVTEEQREYGGGAYREAVRLCNARLRELAVCLTKGVTLADIENFFDAGVDAQAKAELLQYDGVHLSVEGNRAYRRWLEPVFRAILGLGGDLQQSLPVWSGKGQRR
jgi:lysophospholipase L1-like esterase